MKPHFSPLSSRVLRLLIAVWWIGCTPTESGQRTVKPSQKADSGGFNFPDGTNTTGTDTGLAPGWDTGQNRNGGNDTVQPFDGGGAEITQPLADAGNNTDVTLVQPDVGSDTTPVQPDVGNKAPISGGVLIVEVDSSQYELGTAAAHLVYGVLAEATPISTHGLCDVLPGQNLTPPVGGLDSGVITVSGLLKPVTLTPVTAATGTTYSSNLPDSTKNILLGNSPVTATAVGGAQVPGWSLSVQQPQPITILSPTTGVLDQLSSTQALTIKWNGGNGASSTVHLYVVDSSGKAKSGNTVSCTMAGDPGQIIVPQAAIGALPKGGGSLFPNHFLVYAVSRITTSELALPNNAGVATLGVMRTQAGVSGFK